MFWASCELHVISTHQIRLITFSVDPSTKFRRHSSIVFGVVTYGRTNTIVPLCAHFVHFVQRARDNWEKSMFIGGAMLLLVVCDKNYLFGRWLYLENLTSWILCRISVFYFIIIFPWDRYFGIFMTQILRAVFSRKFWIIILPYILLFPPTGHYLS